MSHIAIGLHVLQKLLEDLDREAHLLDPELPEGDEG